MRVTRSKSGIRVRAIAGTNVVILGMSATKAARKGLLGWSSTSSSGRSERSRIKVNHLYIARPFASGTTRDNPSNHMTRTSAGCI